MLSTEVPSSSLAPVAVPHSELPVEATYKENPSTNASDEESNSAATTASAKENGSSSVQLNQKKAISIAGTLL